MADSVPDSVFPLDDRNINLLCASLLIRTWVQLGLREAVVCPGSRSSPLAIAAAAHPDLLAIPCIDERSAGFFALGMAMRSHRPVILICTSGTAGANFYPAVIEATARGIPLVILTADRPPELRHCHAGQAIDQLKLFGTYPRWQTELPLPEPDPGVVRYWRQMGIYGWERSQFPDPGVVHFNIPLREPLAPLLEPDLVHQAGHWHLDFSLSPYNPPPAPLVALPADLPPQGVILAGLAQPTDPVAYSRAVARLSQTLGYPILADGLSPLRYHQGITGPVISNYDLILRDPQTAGRLTPQGVIQLGPLPTSKILRQWLEATQPRRWIVHPRPDNFDPLQGPTLHLRTTVEALGLPPRATVDRQYGQTWQALATAAHRHLDQQITKTTALIAAKVPWLLAHHLPPQTSVVIANSMAVRDVEAFWPGSDRRFSPYCNRGANGIDGTLSTALGIAHNHRPTV
ncbi:MAG: 2-succinyl-5-enolpyruvyl-6-hydroxy-3-cyclohexene-1-carboxylic-acid synthase, partial [Spirulina sp. DLM2.Bin59]